MDVRDKFNEISEKYDSQRRMLIPCFDDFYKIPLEFIEYKGDSPKILDIGCGTGMFSSFFLKKYPFADLTLIDISEKMLEIAKERFAGMVNIKYIVDDYTDFEFSEKFDIIISALSIHHLTDDDKIKIYNNIYKNLNDGGIFINSDQVISPNSEIEKRFSDVWRNFVDNSGLEEDEIKKGYERLKLDNPSTLSDQLKWLHDAGFKSSDCIYKYYHFCILYAKK